MKINKTAGVSGVIAEMVKSFGYTGVELITRVMH